MAHQSLRLRVGAIKGARAIQGRPDILRLCEILAEPAPIATTSNMSTLHQRLATSSESKALLSDDESLTSASKFAPDFSPTVSEEELMSMKGNDYGFPLLIKYEKAGTLKRNMTNMLLENKGPVARDHLANERNYLAWARTSLSFTTVGLAVTSAFRGYGDGVLIAGKIIGGMMHLFIVVFVNRD